MTHYYSVIVMSIGAVRMHRGLADRGHQAGIGPIVDTKEKSVKTPIQFTCSSHPSHSEEETHGARGSMFATLHLIMPEVKWFGGKQDDGSSEKEAV
jgi:hypothetical protein